jgi:hypothetical protein
MARVIVRSLYLLNFIDSLSLRRNVQQALNRGENYYKLHKAVSYVNFGKLGFKPEGEQQIWDQRGQLNRKYPKCIPALLWFSFSLFEPAALLRPRNFREVCQNSFLAAV